jgi:uncharacterized membrane protein
MVLAAGSRIARGLHQLFEASLLFKGLLAGAETIAGIGLYFTSSPAILGYVTWLTKNEIAEDPTDKLAMLAQKSVAALSIETQHFYAFYLLSHGVLKLAMVLALAWRVSWAYPLAMFVLAGFVVYQLYSFVEGGSPLLLALSALDMLMIALVWREYQLMRKGHPA